ncbi:uncharacterized protein T069G_10834 [Trichoderma breve]|uniref:Uncharacterized protein n=1 Tax=Trichoderma breve TaxID=2034170 RepID=A0A9W9E5C5_9HYPO|nr:uncharacterized protein T069G_10834 [Trichoderma breve]KAJ4855276.1 hypothetical protein T069G_10834 [Trichoderma breve]
MEAIAEEESPQPRQLPEFDAAFRDAASSCYFHHIIDVDDATLRVEVLGPNLAYTFRHERAKELRLAASVISKRLEAKVTGFLALRTGRNQKRVVLAWAQSGHGISRLGDLLDPDPSVLPNDLWTKRAINMGRALSLRMNRPYDGIVTRTMGVRMDGVFQGSHVEVKLAVHAICILLSSFGITQDLDNVSPEHLRALRQASWDDGSKPAFEIYFSRKNCSFCGKFVRRLQNATGITLKLIWRDRLVKKVYENRRMDSSRANPPQSQDAIQPDSDTVMTDDVHVIETIDLSSNHPMNSEVVNLTVDSNTISDSPTPEPEFNTRAPTDTYIEGLAYCVGQIDECPASARDAILALAAQQQQQRKATNLENINKPLPATPEIAPPGYAAAASAESEDAVAMETVEAALATNPMLTPPPSGGRQQRARANSSRPRISRNYTWTRDARSQAPPVRKEQVTPTRLPSTHRVSGKDGGGLRIFTAAPHPQGRRGSTMWIELPSRRYSESPEPF